MLHFHKNTKYINWHFHLTLDVGMDELNGIYAHCTAVSTFVVQKQMHICISYTNQEVETLPGAQDFSPCSFVLSI